MGAASKAIRLACSGCGTHLPLTAPHPFVCPRASGDDNVDHVIVRRLDPDAVAWPSAPDANPYLGFGELLSPRHRARALGLHAGVVDELVVELDEAIAAVDGHGFRFTPSRSEPLLAEALELSTAALWAKDETHNVGGSHKARHLMGVMIHLRLAERAELTDAGARAPLAIASCGNAALAAAVVAKAARWPLRVFVPTDASPTVLQRLRELDADIRVCERDGQPGDPCYRGFRSALAQGAVPFSVQGSDNGLAVEGGLTLGYELAEQLRQGPGRIDALVVQVGGGALASACLHALRDAVALGVLPEVPRLHTLQTHSAWPLRRAYDRVVQWIAEQEGATPPEDPRERADWLRGLPEVVLHAALRHAATHRHAFMWPWEQVPQSVADGILDDETYDWYALVEGMLHTGGLPLLADEDTLLQARRAVADFTEVRASATGTAGVAGLLEAQRAGLVREGEVVAVLLTGIAR